MKIAHLVLTAVILSLPLVPLAEDTIPARPVHKYWTCAISSYDSLVDGKYQEARCRVNTAYSEPPCREFVVEFEGPDGIRPSVPYEQKNSSIAADSSTTKIEIVRDNGRYFYKHTIEQAGANTADKWIYNGECRYNEAPASEKIYMDYGLKTTR